MGEALIDVVHYPDGSTHATPGGSPANVAVALGRLGRPVHLVTQWGADAYGDLLASWLAESSVEVTRLGPDEVPTAMATARLDAGGSASYEFTFDWQIAQIGESARFLHVGSLGALHEPGARQVRELVRAQAGQGLVSYDPNVRPGLVENRHETVLAVEDFVGLSDVVKASDEDLEFLYPDEEPLDAAERWLYRGPAMVIVTHGGGGATALVGRARLHVPGVSVQVVDTVGAGDTFMAAFIDGLIRTGPWKETMVDVRGVRTEMVEQLVRHAVTASSITVGRCGMDPPHAAELPLLPGPVAARAHHRSDEG